MIIDKTSKLQNLDSKLQASKEKNPRIRSRLPSSPPRRLCFTFLPLDGSAPLLVHCFDRFSPGTDGFSSYFARFSIYLLVLVVIICCLDRFVVIIVQSTCCLVVMIWVSIYLFCSHNRSIYFARFAICSCSCSI